MDNQPLVNLDEDFDETFDAPPEQTPVETQAVEQTPEEVKAVNGVSLDDLDISESATEEAPKEETKETEKPVGFEQFSKDFEKYIGLPLEGVRSMIAELQAFRVQTLVEKQQSQLRSKWGDDYDSRFDQVKEYFAKLPEDKQKALDNVEGAELIWAFLEKRQNQQKHSTTPQVPTYVSGKTSTSTARASTGNKAVLNYSDIVSMSKQEYRQRQAEIQQAMLEGRINMDLDDPF